MIKFNRWLACVLFLSYFSIICICSALDSNLVIYDLNRDGKLDLTDLSIANQNLNSSCYSQYDINHDGNVNASDVEILALAVLNADNYSALDFNNDGKINVGDQLELVNHLDDISPIRCYDFNHDGVVNAQDAVIIAKNVNAKWNDARYSPLLDINHDGVLNIIDTYTLMKYHMNETCNSCYNFDGNSIVSESATAMISEQLSMTEGFMIDELMIKFSPGVSDTEKLQILTLYNLRKVTEIEALDVDLVETDGNLDDVIIALQNNPKIRYVEKNSLGTPQSYMPNDPSFSNQWDMQMTSLPAAWELTMGSRQIAVAVLDTGIDVSLLDFAGRVTKRYNTFDGSSDIPTPDPHGTWVAGILGAAANNNAGIAGVAPNINLLDVKVCKYSIISCPAYNLATGIAWAADNGARIILVGQSGWESQAVKDAINYALSKNIPIFAPAGSIGGINFPASYPGVFCVGSSNSSMMPSWFSNTGSKLDVLAPGENVTVPCPSWLTYCQTIKVAGTCFAAAHVAGVAALALSLNQNLTVPEIYGLLRNNSWYKNDSGYWTSGKRKDDRYGYGFLYDFYSVTAADPMCPDFNADNVIDEADADIVLMRIGAENGSANPFYRYMYDSRFDLFPRGGDGKINLSDVQYVRDREGRISCLKPLSCSPNCYFSITDMPIEYRMSDANRDGVINDSDREDLQNGYLGDQLIIEFQNSTSELRINQTFATFGFKIRKKFASDIYLVNTPSRNLEWYTSQLTPLPDIKVVAKNHIGTSASFSLPSELYANATCLNGSIVTFNWNPSTGTLLYSVYVRASEDGEWQAGGNVTPEECGKTCQYSWSNLYGESEWKVRAFGEEGYEDSAVASVSGCQAPDNSSEESFLTSANLDVVLQSASCTHRVSWSAKDLGCSNNYVIEWCKDQNNINFGSVPSNCLSSNTANTYFDVPVVAGSHYYWQVIRPAKYCDNANLELVTSGSFVGNGGDKSISFTTDGNKCVGLTYYYEYCTGDRAALPCESFSDAYGGCSCASTTGSPMQFSRMASGITYSWKLWDYKNKCDASHWGNVATGDFTDTCGATPYCGDGAVTTGEQCDAGGGKTFLDNSPQCPQNQYVCNGVHFGYRDATGSCSNCKCVEDVPATYCSKGSCGAACSEDSECIGQYVCNQATCSCAPNGPDTPENLAATSVCAAETPTDTMPVTVTFTWKASSNADYYRVYVWAPELNQWHEGRQVMDYECGATCSDVWYNFPSGTQHIWMVRAFRIGGYADSSELTLTTVSCNIQPQPDTSKPTKPALATPTQACEFDSADDISPVTVTFKWVPSIGADSYKVYVYAPEVSKWLEAASSVSSCGAYCQYTWKDFLPNVGYSWMVRASNNAGYTDSDTTGLTTRNDCTYERPISLLPGKPSLLPPTTKCAPDYAGDTSPVTVTFNWNAATGADYYRVYVYAPDISPTYWHEGRIVNSGECGATCSDVWYDFPAGTSHIWMVRAFNSRGNTDSDQNSFPSEKSCVSAPTQPQSLSADMVCQPENANDALPVTITFKWAKTSDAHHYRVYVYKGPTGWDWYEGGVIYPSQCTTNLCQDTWGNFASGDSRPWLVKAFSSADEQSAVRVDSESALFGPTPNCQGQPAQSCPNAKCETPMEDCSSCPADCGTCGDNPQLLPPTTECSPSDPSDPDPVKVTFKWLPASGANHYKVWVWKGPSMYDWITSASPVYGTAETWYDFPSGTTHTWFVRAYKSTDESVGGVNSDTASFTTISGCLEFPMVSPDDPYYDGQWNLQMIHMPAAWKITTGSPSVIVADLDTGFDLYHPDLAHLQNAPKRNVIDNNDDITDEDGHGTMTLGVIAAQTDNFEGIAGVAPNTGVMLVKIETHESIWKYDYWSTDITEGVNWALDNGAKVISLSFSDGTSDDPDIPGTLEEKDPPLYRAMQRAYNMGVVVVASSGNEAESFDEYNNFIGCPACYDTVLAVGGVNSNADRVPYSNYQTRRPGKLMVMAPTRVLTTQLGGGIDNFWGTSASAPHVAALAGLFFSVAPTRYTNKDFYRLIAETAQHRYGSDSNGWSPQYGYGLVDAYALLKKVDCKRYDFNGDKIIDIIDVQSVAYRYGSKEGDAIYDPLYDVSPYEGDGFIDGDDVREVFNRDYWICP